MTRTLEGTTDMYVRIWTEFRTMPGLRLTRDQEQYWPQVEQALRAISWRIARQQDPKRPVTGKQQASMIDPGSPEVARLKSAAFPLIMSMREDQKQEVRQLAHTMGLKQVASMF